ncbi:glycosyltransferase [Allitabrizicola rongguiensis]|uniref:glycosyltransferase n=1 Tax=Alitabrizicola rongguiensis TaxID=2909234 RepID=UPI003873B4B5
MIMPAYNATRFLDRSLAAVLTLQRQGTVEEVIVVDDGSTDGTAAQARDLGARVIQMAHQAGPAAARNRGSKEASGQILWFVDSDVAVHPDAGEVMQKLMVDPTLVAAFGSYDTNPPEPGWLSRYKNLIHHFYHTQGAGEATTFWAGCGAVRADAFRAVGGFDAARYRYPSIEDIELGDRLRHVGRIRIEPALQATHLKRWRIVNVLRTDILHRALPWSRLIRERSGLADTLNISRLERLRAGLAGLFALSCLTLVADAGLWPLPLVLFVSAILANWRLALFLNRQGGPIFALFGLVWHQLYYIYASATYVWCMFEARLGRR